MSKLKTIGLLCAATVIISAMVGGCVVENEKVNKKVNPYSFDTAKIEYKLEGNIAGTQTVLIKGDMASHKTEAVKTIGGTQENINLLYLELGPARYEINLGDKTGRKSSNPIYEGLAGKEQNEKLDYLIKLAAGVEETAPVPASTGEKVIAGQTCKMYDIGDFGEICVWNGIPLYSKLSLAGGEIENTMTAQSVETGLEINNESFAVPLDVTITDLASV